MELPKSIMKVLTRLQCDEAKPACTNCRRRSTPCDYHTSTSTRYRTPTGPEDGLSTTSYYGNGPDPITSTAASSSHGSTPALGAATLPHAYYAPVVYSFDLFDMELWHHWLTVACYSFADDDLGAVVWRKNISKYAFTHGYVAQLLLVRSTACDSRSARCVPRASYKRLKHCYALLEHD